MPSPFPGMDPYIEVSGDWGDFHTSLLGAVRAELNSRLPRRYRAKIDVFVFVQESGPRLTRRKRLEADVFVVERPQRPSPSAGAATIDAPHVVTLPRVPRKHKSIQIVDRRHNCVVTVIEVLSPVNKLPGDGRAAYLAKRDEYLANRVNLVEIDLLRDGPRLPMGEPDILVLDYYILVCRSWQFPKASLWNLSLRSHLPDIPIPLAQDIAETPLSLRACVDRAYDEGDYGNELPYDEPLLERPRKVDVAWIKKILANRVTPSP